MFLVWSGLLSIVINLFGLIYMWVKPQRYKAVVAIISLLWAAIVLSLSGGIVLAFLPFGVLLNPIGMIISLVVAVPSSLILTFIFKSICGQRKSQHTKLPVVSENNTDISKGLNYYLYKKNDLAIEECNRLLEKSPSNFDAHLLSGFIFRDLGKRQDSEEHIRLALAAEPRHIFARKILGDFLLEWGAKKEAEIEFQHIFPDFNFDKYSISSYRENTDFYCKYDYYHIELRKNGHIKKDKRVLISENENSRIVTQYYRNTMSPDLYLAQIEKLRKAS